MIAVLRKFFVLLSDIKSEFALVFGGVPVGFMGGFNLVEMFALSGLLNTSLDDLFISKKKEVK